MFLVKITQVTQVRNNAEYEQALAEYQKKVAKLQTEIKNAGLNTDEAGTNLAQIQQEASFGKEPDAKVSVSSSYQVVNGDAASNGSDDIKNCVSLVVPANADISGDFATVTWTNLKNTSYKGRPITKIVGTLSGLQYYVHDGNYKKRIAIPNDPSNFFANSGNSLDVDYTYYYDDGSKVDFTDNAYLTAGGMESWGRDSGIQSEAIQLLSSGQALHLPGSSIKVHAGNDLYADINNTYGNDAKIQYGSRKWDAVENYYRAGLFKVSGDHIKVRFHDIWSSPAMANDVTGDLNHHLGDEFDGVSTIIGFGDVVLPIRKSEVVTYHHDVTRNHH